METIKNYLETMFQNLPSTPQVLRAKAELFSMMEDKYSELIREGRTENEAVGTVIAEFGNLEEIAGDLGLESTIREPQGNIEQRRVLSFEEIYECLESYKITSLVTAAGVALCILCPVPVILASSLGSGRLEGLGVLIMFLLIAAGVACFIFTGITTSKWDYIEKEYCMLDYSTNLFVKDEKAKFNGTYVIFLTIGIVFCVLCAVPAIVIDSISTLFPFWYEITGAFVLIPVAVGVFMIVWVGIRMGRMDKLLKLNDRPVRGKAITRDASFTDNRYPNADRQNSTYTGTAYQNNSYQTNSRPGNDQTSGYYDQTYDQTARQDYGNSTSTSMPDSKSGYTNTSGAPNRQSNSYTSYESSLLDTILSVYKPTVTCIYLIWSFLTFDWHITWIIWPISGLIKKILINIWGGKKS